MPCSGGADDLQVSFVDLSVHDRFEATFLAYSVVSYDADVGRQVGFHQVFRDEDLEKPLSSLWEPALKLRYVFPYPTIALRSPAGDLDAEHIHDCTQGNLLLVRV